MGALRLYEVEIIYTAVVLAESEDQAYKVASNQRSQIVSDSGEPEICTGGQINAEKDLPDNWSVDCIPFSSLANDHERHDSDIGFWLDNEQPEVVRDTKTIDMFEEGAQ